MRNQPKYKFFKNTTYALNGFKDMIANETSFKIELVLFVFLLPVVIFIDLEITYKLFMFISLMGILISETINSAIERVVDLVTLEHHEMAGRAKDIGSTIVLLSIINCVLVWCFCIYTIF